MDVKNTEEGESTGPGGGGGGEMKGEPEMLDIVELCDSGVDCAGHRNDRNWLGGER